MPSYFIQLPLPWGFFGPGFARHRYILKRSKHQMICYKVSWGIATSFKAIQTHEMAIRFSVRWKTFSRVVTTSVEIFSSCRLYTSKGVIVGLGLALRFAVFCLNQGVIDDLQLWDVEKCGIGIRWIGSPPVCSCKGMYSKFIWIPSLWRCPENMFMLKVSKFPISGFSTIVDCQSFFLIWSSFMSFSFLCNTDTTGFFRSTLLVWLHGGIGLCKVNQSCSKPTERCPTIQIR